MNKILHERIELTHELKIDDNAEKFYKSIFNKNQNINLKLLNCMVNIADISDKEISNLKFKYFTIYYNVYKEEFGKDNLTFKRIRNTYIKKVFFRIEDFY